MDVVDDLDGMFQIIESDHSLDEQKENFRCIEGRVFVAGDTMKLLDGIIGDIAQGPAKKGRNTWYRNRSIITHELF
jgi:hypothetical protein